MPETAPEYFAILTDAGIALEARALAEGRGIELTHIAVGDANREYVLPKPDATALVHEVWRDGIASRSVSPDDPNITLLHALIPANEGGFWIRELGVIGHLEGEETEVLYAYANHAPYYKMLPQDGQTVTHEIIVPITASGNAKITIIVSDQGYATRSGLEALRAELPGSAAFVELAANLVAVANRVTQIELERLAGATGAQIVSPPLLPSGYQLGGATIAPVTLVPEGGEAPPDAAFVVKMEQISPSTSKTI